MKTNNAANQNSDFRRDFFSDSCKRHLGFSGTKASHFEEVAQPVEEACGAPMGESIGRPRR